MNFYFAGLNPNQEMVNASQFAKFMIMLNIFMIPLLGYSSMDVNTHIFYIGSGLMLVIGLFLELLKKKQV